MHSAVRNRNIDLEIRNGELNQQFDGGRGFAPEISGRSESIVWI